MIRMIVTGLWVCMITAGATSGVAYWKATGGLLSQQQEYLEGLEYVKTKVMNVPMLANGAVQGYVVTQLVFTADAKMLRQLPVPADAFVVDEAFRSIYADERLDFRNLARYDLANLTRGIRERVNERMKAAVIQDVLVEEFNYVAKEDLRK